MSPESADGRTARRERNRLAALDATFELFAEGTALPSIDEVAARSGVSLRSMYRYFSDTHEMHLLALARRTQVADPLYELARVGEGTLEERVERVVDQRLRLYGDMGPAIRMALAIAPTLPAIRDQVEVRKRQLFDQLQSQFAAEVERCPGETGRCLLRCVDVLCQFESLDRLIVEGRLSHRQARDTLRCGLSALLSAAPGTATN